MPEDKTPPSTEPPAEPTPEQTEAAFWQKFEANLDTWFDKKVEKYRGTSPARMGRSTLPGMLADLVFGPPKDK